MLKKVIEALAIVWYLVSSLGRREVPGENVRGCDNDSLSPEEFSFGTRTFYTASFVTWLEEISRGGWTNLFSTRDSLTHKN